MKSQISEFLFYFSHVQKPNVGDTFYVNISKIPVANIAVIGANRKRLDVNT